MRESRIFYSKLEKVNFHNWLNSLQVGDNVTVVTMNGFFCADAKVNPIKVLQIAAITPAGNLKLSDGTVWSRATGLPRKIQLGLLEPTTERNLRVSAALEELLDDSNLSIQEYNKLGEAIMHA